MDLKQINVTKGNSIASKLALGAAVCIGVTVLCTAVGAAMISSGTIPESAMGYGALGILTLSSMAGALTGGWKVQEKRLYLCLLVAALYVALLLAMTATFFGGQYEGVGLSVIMAVLGAFGAAIVGQGRGNGRNLRKSKIKHR